MYFAKTQGRALKELSPEEVTTNVYMMVDVLLHSIHLQLQHGHSLQDLLLRASAGLAHFMWSQELLPFDVVLLALTDRDDDTHALRLVVIISLCTTVFLSSFST
jgi:mediator of RNA polymerase II transcription subunit 23